jgi:hypothetical protein
MFLGPNLGYGSKYRNKEKTIQVVSNPG